MLRADFHTADSVWNTSFTPSPSDEPEQSPAELPPRLLSSSNLPRNLLLTDAGQNQRFGSGTGRSFFGPILLRILRAVRLSRGGTSHHFLFLLLHLILDYLKKNFFLVFNRRAVFAVLNGNYDKDGEPGSGGRDDVHGPPVRCRCVGVRGSW